MLLIISLAAVAVIAGFIIFAVLRVLGWLTQRRLRVDERGHIARETLHYYETEVVRHFDEPHGS